MCICGGADHVGSCSHLAFSLRGKSLDWMEGLGQPGDML